MPSSNLRRLHLQLTSARTGEELHRLLHDAKHAARAVYQAAGHSETAAQCLALKIVNACLARVEFAARRMRPVSRPFGIEVDPCNGCALACPGCVHSKPALFDWPKGMLSPDNMDNYLQRYGPFATHAKFCNYGEPLLNRQTPDYIRMAKRYLTQTMLSTSLSVNKFDPDAYVASGLDYMIVSIDGATQPTYERYRRNGRIDLVYENLRGLIEARRRHQTKLPAIAWQFLAFEHNRHEIPAAMEQARALGVDEIRISRPFDVSWDDPSIRPALDIPAEVIYFTPPTREDFSHNWNRGELNAAAIETTYHSAWPVDDPGPLESGSEGHTCHWLYMNTVMDANGRVLPCCCAPQPGMDIVFGELTKTPEDLFNTSKYQSARAYFRNGVTTPDAPYCQTCEWNQEKADIDPNHIREYARAVNPAVFDEGTARWLARWPLPPPESGIGSFLSLHAASQFPILTSLSQWIKPRIR